MSEFIILSDEQVALSIEMGEIFNNKYTIGDGPTKEQQEFSVMGELALSLFVGEPLEHFLSVRSNNRHHEVETALGVRCDTKSTHNEFSSCLIIPFTKSIVQQTRPVDVYVSVKTNMAPIIELCGWIEHEVFHIKKLVRGEEPGIWAMCHPKLYLGTPYMYNDDLRPMRELLWHRPKKAAA